MKDRSKSSRTFYVASCLLGLLTAFNMMLSTMEPSGLALLVFGLATGLTGGTLLLEAVKNYHPPAGSRISGSNRRKLAFVVGVIFGAAMTPVTAIVSGPGGSLPFIVGLVAGGAVTERVVRTLRRWVRMGADPAADPADDPDDGYEIRIPDFASNSTREELAAGAMMMLGFALASGLALGGLAVIVMITGG